ncbi:MAG TPA: hypothetical protein PLC35_09970 [Methanosarcina vacuolata]|nr:hypothetical protein [Methanosarcina vacuolata]
MGISSSNSNVCWVFGQAFFEKGCGQAFFQKGCGQAFFEKGCDHAAPRDFSLRLFFEKACEDAIFLKACSITKLKSSTVITE